MTLTLTVYTTPAGVDALSQTIWKHLLSLDLSSCDLGAHAVASLSAGQLGGGCGLTSLNLSHNPLRGVSGPPLHGLLCALPSLRQLRLCGCQLDDLGIEAMVKALTSHSSLELLDLTENLCEAAGGYG